MEIVLTQGRVALVDDEDYATLSQYKWFCTSGRYAARWESRNIMVYMHDVVMGVESGVDHINRDSFDNRKSNLRVASASLQKFNRLLPKKAFPRGVFREKNGRFRARIWVDGRSISLGRYDTPEEARQVYREKALEIRGEYPPEHDD